jgi:hypothetical protein
MPLTYEIDDMRGVITVTATGELTDQQLIDLHNRFASDPAVRPAFAILFDMRGATDAGVTPEGVRNLAGLPFIVSRESKRAVVVRTDLGFGMARMYGLRREARGPAFEVFRDIDEAKRWVGLDTTAQKRA